MQLKLDVKRQGQIAVVYCEGRIVFGQEVDELRLVVLSQLRETNRIVLQLGGIEQIDSEGLAALVGLFISARNRNGELKVANPSAKSRSLLHMTRLDEIFGTYKSEEDAIAAFAIGARAAAAASKITDQEETQF